MSLFRTASVMPENIIATLERSEEKSYSRNSKGFILNADPMSLLQFPHIGS